ncbi:MAG: SufS family cysteine desulfurase [Gammaproteobacteria bacterium]|nr:SufS family cysteine desulfurase [Gammaproteobacteria bacterium]
MTNFDVHSVRADFPILQQTVNNHPLVYLDNAATTQKPQAVLDALMHYYTHDNANVHRGAHLLADRATRHFEAARDTVRDFLGARESAEILWAKGTTESINVIAQCFLPTIVSKGDKVMVSAMEHHANFVPWQQQCLALGLELVVMPVLDNGELDMQAFADLLDERVKFVSIGHVSNSLGTINPIKKIIDAAHSVGAKVLIDGAQAVSHFDIDVQSLDCDFYVFSGHKLFAPTGIGVLYGKREYLETMPVYQMGGEMIAEVTLSETTFNVLPYRFEAGTPNIAGVIGLKAAIDYLSGIERGGREAHEKLLLQQLTAGAESIDGLNIIGTAEHKTSVLSFVMHGMHCQDIGTLLDQQGIAVRTGHHCTMPIMQQFGLSAGTVRASVAFYNTENDVTQFLTALEKAKRFLG